jgi:hypothetical protein
VRRRRAIAVFLSHAFCPVVACLLPACAHDYRPPKPGEPHALVKLHLAYHAWPSTLLEQVVTIDGDPVRDVPSPTQEGKRRTTCSVRVRPGPAVWAIQATFFHNEVTSRAETYETTESAPCGSSTCTQIRPHTRLVNHVDRVNDATCRQDTKLVATAGETYILEYDYRSDRSCSLVCRRQNRHRQGVSSTSPCVGPADTSAKR